MYIIYIIYYKQAKTENRVFAQTDNYNNHAYSVGYFCVHVII